MCLTAFLFNLLNKKTEFSKEGLKIVQVARLDHLGKGQHIAIQALSLLIGKGIKNISLNFIGEDPSLEYLKKITAELSLNQYVNFLGNKSQQYIFEHLCDYDLSLALSSYEAFGLTVAEAMAAKVPVLASDIPAFREVLDNGQLGNLFKIGDAEYLSNKIAGFIEKCPDRQMIEAAYERVKSLYSVETTARRYLEEYKKI
ncbi:hypothetical protein AGMMS49938_01590 [Fibrobacterales bacterium]|nr:hypothetical protein AGMMS49938_01590 [Fibrobacterales bacterium]